MEFRLKNFKIKIEFSFIFVLSLSLIFGYENAGRLILFSCVHETAHLAALFIVGGKAEILTISFFGISLKYDTALPRFKEFIVISAGPLINIILFLILKDDINLFLAVLNLLPIYPLDGGRLIRIFFPNAIKQISLAFLTAMLIASIYLLVKYSIFSLLLVCLYLIAFNMRSV